MTDTPSHAAPNRRLRRGIAGLFALGALVLGAGCSTNPATGESMLSFISPEEEAQIGAREHGKLVPAFGGAMDDPDIQRYVASLGGLLARTTETPNQRFTFTVLDTDTVNAFALPGGYIYITRGLMALANSEAEVAGVLAHEIGHVTARHAAQRHTRSVFAGIGAAAVGILTGSGDLAQLAGGGLQTYLRSYSRGQEFQADTLGIRYLKRAGFEPKAMASFLKSMRAQSRLSAKLMGQPANTVDQANIMSTHPRTLERVERAAQAADGGAPKNPIVGRDVYLRKIDGMIYGDSPEQGFVRGNEFRHPVMRFRFRLPRGYHMINRPTQVLARGPDGTIVIFGSAPRAGGRTPYDYLVNVWARRQRLYDLESFTVNGLRAASGAAQLRTRRGVRGLRLLTIRQGGRMYRFMFIGPGAVDGPDLRRLTRRTARSFTPVTRDEARSWRPYRIALRRVRPGDTVAKLARRMAVPRLREEHFRALNGLGPGDRLTPGRRVKLVRLGRSRGS